MDTTAVMWFLCGAGAVLLAQAVLRLLRSAAKEDDRFPPAPQGSPPLLSGAVPYRIDQRAMPVSEDLDLFLEAFLY
jgi:hypothetical protein